MRTAPRLDGDQLCSEREVALRALCSPLSGSTSPGPGKDVGHTQRNGGNRRGGATGPRAMPPMIWDLQDLARLYCLSVRLGKGVDAAARVSQSEQRREARGSSL